MKKIKNNTNVTIKLHGKGAIKAGDVIEVDDKLAESLLSCSDWLEVKDRKQRKKKPVFMATKIDLED